MLIFASLFSVFVYGALPNCFCRYVPNVEHLGPIGLHMWQILAKYRPAKHSTELQPRLHRLFLS